MKAARLLLAVSASLVPAFAAYTYEYPTLLNPYSSGSWNSNGTNNASTGMYTSSATNGGSLIFKSAINTPSSYEVRFTLSLAGSGGNYFTYLRASSNSQYVTGNTGTYYAVEIANPTLSQGSYSATLNFIKSVSGTVTVPYSTTIYPSNGAVIRVVMLAGNAMAIYINNVFWTSYYDTSNNPITTGQPGVGVSNAPSGNGMSTIDIGQLDVTAPNPIDTQLVGTSVFPTRVDIQFPEVLDQNVTPPGGTGVAYYQFYRDGSWLTLSPTPNIEDRTVVASTSYTYELMACDFHANCTTANVNVTTPPAGAIDPREVGVRPTGTYWGGAGEQIDMRSGNLNFTIPLLKVMSRGGGGIGVNLSYNSQNWRQDTGGTWQLGHDIGYGYGWRLAAGALTPIYSDLWTLDHYEFVDSTGAEYRLDVNTNGVWSSKEGIYVYYDSNAGRLHFTNGSFWIFGCTSGGTEQDSGAMYPTEIYDSNGNIISINYYAGVGLTTNNSSSRIDTIEDVRGNGGFDYSFTFNSDAIPHLTGITNSIGTAENYTFHYAESQPLNSPFTPSTGYGNWTFLSSVANAIPLTTSFTYDPSGSGELDQVTFPYGGHLRWAYGGFNYSGTRTLREVNGGRFLLMAAGGTELTYGISFQTTAGITFHTYSQVDDPDGQSEKAWAFQTTSGNPGYGLMYYLENRPHHYPNTAGEHAESRTWSADSVGNPYISSVYTTEDNGNPTAVSKTTNQTVDQYGNVTQTQLYGYAPTGSGQPLLRTYNNTYLNTSTYTSLYILNRLLTSTVTDGTYTTTLASNTYDCCVLNAASGIYEHDSGYNTTYQTRGNVTTSVTPAGTKTMNYDIAGNVTLVNNNGLSTSATVNTTTNYAAPSAITTNSLTSNMSWSSFLGLNSATGPNGDTGSIGYDTNARPHTTTSTLGAVTTYTYNDSASPPNKIATTNGHWVQTNMDGLGRTINTLTGNGTSTVSEVDTVYVPCGCSPMGKVGQVSQPYTGSTKYWTVYHYDGLGRTTSVVAPDGASTTTYSYSGNTVTVTDPAGKYKTFTMDALGNLAQVQEPDPTLGTVNTTYSYDILNHLVQVSMLRGSNTQTRSFNYITGTSVGINLLGATNPENGMVTYTYNSDNTLATKHDANGNQFAYTYDSYKRLTKITVGGNTLRTFMYDSNTLDSSYSGSYTQGRLVAVQNTGFTPIGYTFGSATIPATIQFTEMYGYTQAGLTSGKRLQVNETFYGNTLPAATNLDTAYTYDSEGKTTSVNYPTTYSWNGTQLTPTTGPKYTYSFDAMDRPTGLTDQNNNTAVSYVSYNPANQLLGITYFSTNESRTYNSLNQMTNLTVGSTLNITYTFPSSTNNGKISSQMDSISGETVTYQYDSLNRLLTAAGSGWGETYAYDGFGNLLSKTGTGTGPTLSQSVNASTNRVVGQSYDSNGNQTSSSAGTLAYDAENRLLTAPGVEYGYDSRNKRVWGATLSGGVLTQTVHVYGADGQKIGSYPFVQVSGSIQVFTDSGPTLAVFFGAKRVGMISSTGVKSPLVQDRLGSSGKYYPYGEARGTVPQDAVGFATYTNDSATGLQYADQRYYANNFGRFMTPDPRMLGANPNRPQSWNRYPYSEGDPIGYMDPSGEYFEDCADEGCVPARCSLGFLPGDPTTNQDCGQPPCGYGVDGTNFAPAPGSPFCPVAFAPSPRPKLRPVYLKVVEDCYDRSAAALALSGGAALREITYAPVDINGAALTYSVTVTESNTVIKGASTSVNSSWTVAPGGTFEDYISSGAGQPAFQENQTFTVSGAGYVSAQIVIQGFFGEWKVLGAYATPSAVIINNTVPLNKDGTPHYCDQPDSWRMQ